MIIWPQIGIFGHFGPNIGIFCPFGPMPVQKTMQTRCLGGFAVMWVTKRLISPAKIRTFCPKTIIFGPKLAFCVHFGPGLAGSFGALLVGWLAVVARGLYLARHLFTLFYDFVVTFTLFLYPFCAFKILQISCDILYHIPNNHVISRGSKNNIAL